MDDWITILKSQSDQELVMLYKAMLYDLLACKTDQKDILFEKLKDIREEIELRYEIIERSKKCAENQ